MEIKERKKGKSYFDSKELQLYVSVILNLVLMFAMAITFRKFFKMLKTLGMREGAVKFLKVMLIVLTVSFLIRSFLLTIGTIELVTVHRQWVSFCTICVTLFLILGELVPIATIFWYHLYSKPTTKP